MSLEKYRNELLTLLEQKKQRKCRVVVMPDFFMDRIVNLPWNSSEFSRITETMSKLKGGSLDCISQTNLNGGNAINTAHALVYLDFIVTPIICTSKQGLKHIKNHFKKMRIDKSHIKICGSTSITTALEFSNKKEKINIMLRDLGGLSNFKPDDLNEKDLSLIAKADYICVFNWAGTLNYGTALAQKVFEYTKKKGKGKTYYDPADPTPNTKEMPNLVKKVLKTCQVDILSVNEKEAITFANQIKEGFIENKKALSPTELAMEAARILNKSFSARIDLHTTTFSASLNSKQEVVVPTFKSKIIRATGAGDTWNAGNIFGDYYGFSDECRLLLANAMSAYYLSSVDGSHPTKSELSSFLKNTPLSNSKFF